MCVCCVARGLLGSVGSSGLPYKVRFLDVLVKAHMWRCLLLQVVVTIAVGTATVVVVVNAGSGGLSSLTGKTAWQVLWTTSIRKERLDNAWADPPYGLHAKR